MGKIIGNAVVGQSGGPTVAINATLAGVVRGVLDDVSGGAIRTLYGMKNGIEGLLEERLIDLTAYFKEGDALELLEHTPAAALGSCRKRLPRPGEDDGVYARLLAIFKKYDIRYFFYIGGNDSMDTVAKLSAYTAKNDYEMRIVGVPKTIDNDLIVTDHTPGFGSAAKYIAVTMQEILRDCAVYTTKAVTIVEIMGRDAGWLTAAAGIPLATGGDVPDLLYLPERAFSKEAFFEDIAEALARHPNVVVAVSEGLRFADGSYVSAGKDGAKADVFGHQQLSGTGKTLEILVRERFGCKVRSVELNLPQRCAAHLASKRDLDESLLVGRAAVAAAGEGVTREMMTLLREDDPYRVTVGHSDVAAIANRIKAVPTEFINARGNHITKACADYLLPLIEGEAHPRYQNGLPQFLIF